MNEYTVNNKLPINLRATGVEKVLQNIRNILATTRGEVPLKRDFGLDSNLIDRPINLIKAPLINDIIEQINKWEKRAKVKKIKFDNDIDGKLIIFVKVEVSNERNI